MVQCGLNSPEIKEYKILTNLHLEVFDQGFEEDLDLSVAQGCRWGTLVLHWEGQGNPLDPGADPGGSWLN